MAKPDVYLPLKSSDTKICDVTKYGGYNKMSVAYFFLVEHGPAGKTVRTLETVPIYLANRIKSAEDLEDYAKETLRLVNPRVIVSIIRLQSLFEKEGFRFHVTGKTNKQLTTRNATSLCLGKEWVRYIRALEKGKETGKIDEAVTREKNLELYDILTDKFLNGFFSKRPNPVGNKLGIGREKFSLLEKGDQADLLLQIINLSVIGKTQADLTMIGESKQSGVMLISKNVAPDDSLYLVHQSITGIFEEKVNLATV